MRILQEQTGGSGDASMEGLIKAGTLALQLLPRNALKGMYMYVLIHHNIRNCGIQIIITFVQNKTS